MPERPFSVDRVCQWVLRCLQRDDAAIVSDATAAVKTVPPERRAEAEVFFG